MWKRTNFIFLSNGDNTTAQVQISFSFITIFEYIPLQKSGKFSFASYIYSETYILMKGNSREPENVTFMSSCPLYTG
jgi:hypothetical protein